MYAQFLHSALGDVVGLVQLVCYCTCCLAWGFIFDRRTDRGAVRVFSIVNAGGSVCGCMCVYTHTHTHTAGFSDVSPGVRMRHLEGPKYPDGLNLSICVFDYVYKVHMCMHMLGSDMRSWTNCFFSLHIFFRKRKEKDVSSKPMISQI